MNRLTKILLKYAQDYIPRPPPTADYSNEQWAGILNFLAGSLEREKACELIHTLSNPKTPNNLGRALYCLTEINNVKYGENKEIDKIVEDYISKGDIWDIDSRQYIFAAAFLLNANISSDKKNALLEKIYFQTYVGGRRRSYFSKSEPSVPWHVLNDSGLDSVINFLAKKTDTDLKRSLSTITDFAFYLGERIKKEAARKFKRTLLIEKYPRSHIYGLLLRKGLEPSDLISLLTSKEMVENEENFYACLTQLGTGVDQSGLRHQLIDSLKEMGNTSVPVLIRFLQSDFPNSHLAAKTLGKMGAEEAVGPLIKVLKKQLSAGEHEHPEDNFPGAISPFVELFQSNTPGKYDLALNEEAKRLIASNQFFEMIINGLRLFYLKKDYAAEALGEIGDSAVKPLMELLNSKNPERFYAAKALGGIYSAKTIGGMFPVEMAPQDEEAADSLIRMLNSNYSKRHWAAYALRNIGEPKCVEPLIGYIDYLLLDEPDDRDYCEEALLFGVGTLEAYSLSDERAKDYLMQKEDLLRDKYKITVHKPEDFSNLKIEDFDNPKAEKKSKEEPSIAEDLDDIPF